MPTATLLPIQVHVNQTGTASTMRRLVSPRKRERTLSRTIQVFIIPHSVEYRSGGRTIMLGLGLENSKRVATEVHKRATRNI